jgi:hypothetical protein
VLEGSNYSDVISTVCSGATAVGTAATVTITAFAIHVEICSRTLQQAAYCTLLVLLTGLHTNSIVYYAV